MVISTLGTWMNEVSASWLMTTLSSDPAMVALIPVASLLPVFLLALPAGALADIVDRRRYLLIALSWLALCAGVLAIFSKSELIGVWQLVGLAACTGIGAAFIVPAFQSVVPDLVPRRELLAALTLNAIAANATRAVGPAVAGLIIAYAGPGWVFGCNCIFYLFALWAIYSWRHNPISSTLPSEQFIGAIRSGVRYLARSRPLQVVILRGVLYFIPVSATVALLPLIVRIELGYGPDVFGNLTACIGLGAVGVGLGLRRIRKYLRSDDLVVIGGIATVISTLALAYSQDVWVVGGFMILFGGAWISVLSTLQLNAQLVLPKWVRARGLAIYIASFSGTIAVGAFAWGNFASQTSIPIALTTAAITAAVGVVIGVPLSLNRNDSLDNTPVQPVPDPVLSDAIGEHEGVVSVQVKYLIDPSDVDEFLHVMCTVKRTMRRRNGAISWGVFQDTDNPNCFIEEFVEESWIQHLRNRNRVSKDDMVVIDITKSFHRGDHPPEISRMISRRPSREYLSERQKR